MWCFLDEWQGINTSHYLSGECKEVGQASDENSTKLSRRHSSITSLNLQAKSWRHGGMLSLM